MGVRSHLLSYVLLLLVASVASVASAQSVSDHLQLSQIRDYVLKGFNLSSIPDVSKMNVSQEEFTRSFSRYIERQPGINLHVLSPTVDMKNRRLLYSLEAIKDEKVHQANLRVLAQGGSRVIIRLLRSRSVVSISKRVPRSDSPLWTIIDLTDVINERLSEGVLNLELQLSCRNFGTVGPSVNVVTNRLDSNRAKRSLRTDCFKDNHRKRCCRHNMDVVFKDLPGFEFIIQPYSFDAGYCKGRCPARYNPAHHHALLQSLIWKQDRQRAPRPCCAPSKLADLEILHLDQDDPSVLKVSTWKNMRVLECACS